MGDGLVDPGPPDLRHATLTGVRWTAMSRAVAEVAVLTSTVALAHLMPPSAFGNAAVASIVIALAALLGPGGITAPLVQRRSIRPDHVAASVMLSLAAAATLTALTVAFAQWAAVPLFGATTADLITLASPAWLIASIGAVPQALLQRDLRFKRLAFIDSSSVVAGSVVAVVLAISGFDGSAIILGALATLAAASLLSLRAAPRGLRGFAVRGVRDVGPFAATQAASGLAYSAFRNVDYAILGARLPAADVGFYWRAFQLGVLYQARISQVLSRVSFPVYSRTETREDLLALRLKITRVHATVLVPLICGFIATAPIMIPLIFGDAWEPAVAPAQILAIGGICDAIMTGTGPLMVAIGRPGILLTGTLLSLAAYGALIFATSFFGLNWVAVGVAAFGVIEAAAWQHFMLRPYAGVPNRQFFLESLPGLVVGALLVLVLIPSRIALDAIGIGSVAALAILAGWGLGVYIAALRVLFPRLLAELTHVVLRLGGRRPGSEAEAPVGP